MILNLKFKVAVNYERETTHGISFEIFLMESCIWNTEWDDLKVFTNSLRKGANVCDSLLHKCQYKLTISIKCLS